MSTFTEWNGPSAGRGASTKDVLALIDAYNQVNAALSKHIESTATDDVHRFNSALQEALAELSNTLSATIASKAETATVTALSTRVSANESAINVETSRAQGAESEIAASVTAETARAQTQENTLNAAIEALEASFNLFRESYSQAAGQISFDDNVTTTVEGIVAATEYFIGAVRVRQLVDYVEWTTLSAQFAGISSNDDGTKSNGVYVLGRLSEEWDPDKGFAEIVKQKSARVYIKYINDRPFDIVVDISATGAEKGKISCTASFLKEWSSDDPDDAWEDMTLHLMSNTDSSGAAHVYLGISARGLAGQSTIFHVAGENFIAGGNINGITSSIGFTHVSPGFNAYRANFDDLRVQELHDNQGSPMLSVSYQQGDDDYTAQKILYVADTTFAGVYFRCRPSVLFSEEDSEGNATSYIAPVLTAYDLDALTTSGGLQGIIVMWPQWEEASVDDPNNPGTSILIRRAINYPDGWIACDGSTVSTTMYPELIDILGLSASAATAQLPLMDYSIMRLKGLFDDVDLPDSSSVQVSLTTQELTEAIQSLRDSISEEAAAREEGDAVSNSLVNTEAAARAEADSALQSQIDQLDADKAESWSGTKEEFDSAKSGLSDGTIVLSPDALGD